MVIIAYCIFSIYGPMMPPAGRQVSRGGTSNVPTASSQTRQPRLTVAFDAVDSVALGDTG